MKPRTLYPLRLRPLYKHYPWGGDRILKTFGRREPAGIYAESWEVTDRRLEQSLVHNGPLAGMPLRELIALHGRALLGARCKAKRFPLLIKLIDARERLSVQVHPGEQTPGGLGNEPKNEMWHILEADEKAHVFAGLKTGITREIFEKALHAQRVADCLRRIPVKKGDTLSIPGGRVHAIGAGCLLLEVQQNSDTTYRLYDWDRKDASGRSRPLHVDQALQTIRWNDREDALLPPSAPQMRGRNLRHTLLRGRYFDVAKLELQEPFEAVRKHPTWDVVFVAEGSCGLEWQGPAKLLPPGSTWLLPAALGGYTLRPDRHSIVLRVRPPKTFHR